jgi:hypothetical protein
MVIGSDRRLDSYPYSVIVTTAARGAPVSRLSHPAHRRFTDNGRRARYGAAYVRALCAQAGAGFNETSVDEDVMAVDASVDFARMPVRVQIKCTSQFKVSGNKLTLSLEPGWVTNWSDSDTPVFVVVVKVPSLVPDWLTFNSAFTRHNTVAYGRRFIAATDLTSMSFDANHRLTAESIYDWRDTAYAIADGTLT